MPLFFAQPPVTVSFSLTPTLLSRVKQRFATAAWMPAATSGGGCRLARRLITSDSAKTLHWAVTGIADLALSDRSENAGSSILNTRAIAS